MEIMDVKGKFVRKVFVSKVLKVMYVKGLWGSIMIKVCVWNMYKDNNWLNRNIVCNLIGFLWKCYF